ncbi:MAG: hypothetical protein H7177_03845 [Rhizobacter sp.]|nr:hypothetical protein [Bacteriovorax sp.]
MKLKTLLLLLCSVFSTYIYSAEQVTDPSFHIECRQNDRSFSLDFSSPSKDWTEDDMAITFIKSNEAGKVLKVPAKTFYYTDNISKTQDALCKNDKQVNTFAAYTVNENLMVMFVKSSGRPGLDMVHAILVDTKEGAVVDSKELGRSKNHYVAVLKAKNGFKLRLARDSKSLNKLVTCDCDASIVDDWMEITFKKNKIISSWSSK